MNGTGETLKLKLKQLFLNYCDFSVETGEIFITCTNLQKVLKDSGIFDNKFTNHKFAILLSKEFKVPANHVKNLSFE